MITRREIMALSAKAGVALAASNWLSSPAWAGGPNDNVPPFDFSDSFYTENGIDVSLLSGMGGNRSGTAFGPPRVNPDGTINWVEDNSNTDPTRNSFRITQTTGGFDKDANLIYYSIFGFLQNQSFFTSNAFGIRAHNLANQFRAFIFPKQLKNGRIVFNTCAPPGNGDCVVLGPADTNRREDNVFDTADTYFCQNLLGLWVIDFVLYTPAAFDTLEGQAAMSDLGAKNGYNTDGTAVFKRTSEIDSFTQHGWVQQITLPEDGSQGFRWVV